MKKHFNTAGKCYADEHYMVDIHRQLEQIKEMVTQGDYFCINRARQSGKTTTLSLLKSALEDEYTIFSISFEGIGTSVFATDETLAYAFLCLLNDCLTYNEVKQAAQPLKELLADAVSSASDGLSFITLSRLVSQICTASDKPVILFIDEVDQTGNHSSFLEFLGMLRDKYLKRRERPTFWSVILASVFDIKNLKLKLRSQEAQQYNSPWNIAAEFDIDMNFTKTDIEGMLLSYEKDHQTGMDISLIAGLLYDYTFGYPFLVSQLCKIMDEKLPGRAEYDGQKSVWNKDGFQAALQLLLSESNTLFDDMQKKISDNHYLKKIL